MLQKIARAWKTVDQRHQCGGGTAIECDLHHADASGRGVWSPRSSSPRLVPAGSTRRAPPGHLSQLHAARGPAHGAGSPSPCASHSPQASTKTNPLRTGVAGHLGLPQCKRLRSSSTPAPFPVLGCCDPRRQKPDVELAENLLAVSGKVVTGFSGATAAVRRSQGALSSASGPALRLAGGGVPRRRRAHTDRYSALFVPGHRGQLARRDGPFAGLADRQLHKYSNLGHSASGPDGATKAAAWAYFCAALR
jgi:hypothetical protein